MKAIIYLCGAAAFASVLSGCSGDMDSLSAEGRGVLSLKVNMQHENVSVQTRSAAEVSKSPEENCIIKISNAKGLLRQYEGLSNMPDTLHFMSGNYFVDVEAGDSVASSFTEKYYKGKKDFTVTKGSYIKETVICTIQNVLASVSFADGMEDVFEDDFRVKLYTAAGGDTLTITKENFGQTAYFMPAQGVTQLGWAFTATVKGSGEVYMQDDVIGNIQKATRYDLKFSYTEDGVNTGGAWLDIAVDRTAIEIENGIEIFEAPKVWGEDFDISAISAMQIGAGEQTTVWIAASSIVEKLILSCDKLTDWGFESSQVNLKGYENDNLLSITNSYAPDGTNYVKVVFSEELMKKISSEEGMYVMDFFVKGVEDVLPVTRQWRISVSNANVITYDIDESKVWTSRAVVSGQVINQLGTVQFRYRVKSTGETGWRYVDAVVNGNLMEAELISLDSGVTYEYQAVTGDDMSARISEFTTEEELQLPNSGFEDFQYIKSHMSNNTCYQFYAPGDNLWWDTGNHGSATMGMNVTTPCDTVKSSGDYSIQLSSQFVGVSIFGKFAAGNLFAGRYLKTDGTDGVLGWGRQWNSRPAGFAGYVKYNSGIVNYASEYIQDKAQDIGTIYIALGDWSAKEESGDSWPVIIKTKSKELFDTNPETNKGLIAFGEINYNESTDGMIRFNIPIEYFSDRKPTSIVVVASASKYGDYFSGSTSSKMWLDDLELIYD